jgi:Ni/Fe-hydrogenase subunit HybB-like protein
MKWASKMLERPWRLIGWLCVVAGLYATFIRFTRGLGASTNLNDDFPWGLWVGFDVICGVGLAAGGFTISAIVYIFRLEKYRPIAKPAVLAAFIGYLMVVGGLLFDLGHPWRLWHPLVMWNHHSVMFEVSWCVTLYTIVLALEVSSLVLERLNWSRALRIVHVAVLPLTLAAVLLSMLHQSSLGSLFLLVPERLHAFWYSPLLPLHFFVSAMAVGCAMTIVESNLSSRAFGRCVEADVLGGVARIAAGLLGVYLVLRVGDLVVRGVTRELWPLNRASVFFMAELLLGTVIPMILFSLDRIRRNTKWLYHAGQLAVVGFVVGRLNVSVTGFEVAAGKSYVPSWTEFAVTLMLVVIGIRFFYLAAKYLPVFESDHDAGLRSRRWREEIERQAHSLPDALSVARAGAFRGSLGA